MDLAQNISSDIRTALDRLEEILGGHDPYPASTAKMFRWERLPAGLVVNLHRENHKAVCVWVHCRVPPSNLRFGHYLTSGPDGPSSTRNSNLSPQIQAGPHAFYRDDDGSFRQLAEAIEFLQSELTPAASASTGRDWSRAEVDLIVGDYFVMLKTELLGLSLNKSEHNKVLASKLNQRSKGSIEFKHQNISAVLINMGLPYIDGYKPRVNFQALLGTAVEIYLDRHSGFFERLADEKLLNPVDIPVIGTVSVDKLFVPPPEQLIVPHGLQQPWLSERGRKMDFVRRDAENRKLGKLGETWVVEVERRRLLGNGRDDLAKKVVHVAEDWGDGVGYDVLSFDERDESEKWVEVKTTGLGQFHPFLVTSNEVRCSEAEPQKYNLYRVFNFSKEARLYVLPGPLSAACKLEPVVYRASL